MERKYTQLDCERRYQIWAMLKMNHKPAAIAREIGVHKSTVSREIARNTGKRGYRPKQAQALCIERRAGARNACRISEASWELVKACLQEGLSPEQISGRLKQTGGASISHESIYRYVYADKRQGGDLAHHLRGQKPYRKRYGSGQERRGVIRNRVGIEHRPAIVETRERIGDWEGDTVIGKGHQGALVTLAERHSRYTLAARVEGKSAPGVTAVITALLRPHRDRCHTITLDNGKEFAEHEKFAAELGTNVYFARPYHSWERGLNENTNGLLRQYFPKNTNLKTITDEQVQSAVDRLNHRPRKCLGFKTPHEVFFNQPSSWTDQKMSVALRI